MGWYCLFVGRVGLGWVWLIFRILSFECVDFVRDGFVLVIFFLKFFENLSGVGKLIVY